MKCKLEIEGNDRVTAYAAQRVTINHRGTIGMSIDLTTLQKTVKKWCGEAERTTE
jgi:hypothetical protein